MGSGSSPADRRRFRRIQAPVLCRPVGRYFQKHRRPVSDVSRGGLRVYTDDAHQVGERLEMELTLPDASQVVFQMEVVWIDPLADGQPAQFEVGLRFIELSPDDSARLEAVLSD